MVQTGFNILKIGIIIAVVIGVIGIVSFSWTLNTSPYLATLSTIFSIICYILPIKQLAPIITLFVLSMIFRVTISVIRALWQLIPISG